MKYQQATFTLPTVNKRMTQTEYEIRVGLRNPDGTLVRPKLSCGHALPIWKCRVCMGFRRIPEDGAVG